MPREGPGSVQTAVIVSLVDTLCSRQGGIPLVLSLPNLVFFAPVTGLVLLATWMLLKTLGGDSHAAAVPDLDC
jgi:hypothetical protein